MPLKYENEIVTRKNCDLDHFNEQERPAYCWVFANIDNAKNFLPRAISVKRDNCESWALSFFDSESQAENRLRTLTNDKKNLFKFLGDHIACGILDTNDGISEKSDGNGHFNLHEYVGTDFANKFTITKKIS